MHARAAVESPRVRPALRGSVDTGVCVAPGDQGGPVLGRDADAGIAVSAVWLSQIHIYLAREGHALGSDRRLVRRNPSRPHFGYRSGTRTIATLAPLCVRCACAVGG